MPRAKPSPGRNRISTGHMGTIRGEGRSKFRFLSATDDEALLGAIEFHFFGLGMHARHDEHPWPICKSDYIPDLKVLRETIAI